jgi:hypothetical protein
LTTASQNSAGEYRYNVATVPLLAEVLKLAFSLVLLQRETRAARRANAAVKMTIDAKAVSMYAFPSLIFLMHHSIAFPALQYLDPATFQVLGNLKIVTTGGGRHRPRSCSHMRLLVPFTMRAHTPPAFVPRTVHISSFQVMVCFLHRFRTVCSPCWLTHAHMERL